MQFRKRIVSSKTKKNYSERALVARGSEKRSGREFSFPAAKYFVKKIFVSLSLSLSLSLFSSPTHIFHKLFSATRVTAASPEAPNPPLGAAEEEGALFVFEEEEEEAEEEPEFLSLFADALC